MLSIAVVLSACNSKDKCSDGCATGFVCKDDKCIPISSGRALGFDINPPTDSMSARTELPMVTSTGDPVMVVLDSNVAIMGTVVPQPMMAPQVMAQQMTTQLKYSSEAHVAVSIPSSIPGRADLQITTDMASNAFMFTVGSSRAMPGVPAVLTFTPGATASQSQPPIPIQVTQLQPVLMVDFPTIDEILVIRGQLVDPQGIGLFGYVARAFYKGVQVSNGSPTSSDGTFGLLIPQNAVANGGADNITLTMTPPPNQAVSPPAVDLPQFRSIEVQAKELALETAVQPQSYTLPVFAPAMNQPPFQFLVIANGQPQKGVSVTFTMNQPIAPNGSAYFQTSSVSDASGIVSVYLVAGTTDQPISYQVMVQGPADATFGYASQCNPALPISLDASGNPPLPAVTFTLAPRVQLSGTVSDAMAAPAVDATVTATQTGGVTDCGVDATAPQPFSTTSGSGGDYKMLVDPGSYTIDVDPPPMASWPRVTLSGTDAVTLTAAMVRNITLPAGQFVEGYVYAPDGAAIPTANVEIFDVFCKEAPCGAVQAPVSLAKMQTDPTGKFQAVIPMTLP